MAQPAVGRKAPEFTLPSGEGKNISLGDLKGKKIVLYFYPKDDTPGCIKEACAFRDSNKEIKAKGAVVIGISADGVESHRKFSDKYDLSFPLVSDEKKEVVRKYGVWGKKSFMGKEYMGIVRTTFIINEKGIITHIFPKVRVAGHSQEVLDAL